MLTKTNTARRIGAGLMATGVLLAFTSPVFAEGTQVAFLNASSANTWMAAAQKEIEKIATDNGIKIVEFDAQFDPAAQASQFQDVISSGSYDGVILASVAAEGSIPDVKAALEAGMEVVVVDTIVGVDLSITGPQVDGVSASIVTPPSEYGRRAGVAALAACEGMDPCNVVYIYGYKGFPPDDVLREGFDAKITEGTNITVVAEGDGEYLGPEKGMALVQDLLQVTSDVDVIVGPDQSVQGALLALEDAGMAESVKLIGIGGSETALKAIADGAWFGGVFGSPGDQGRLAMDAMLKALAGDADVGGVDPVAGYPDDGVITQGNVGEFTAQWDG